MQNITNTFKNLTEGPQMQKKSCLFLIIFSALFLSLLVAPGPASAKSTTRRFNLPEHGVLEMSVPASWKEQVDQPKGGYPPTITLTSKSGDRMQMIITPLWSMTQKEGFNNPSRLKKILERDGRDMLPGSDDGSVEVKEIKCKDGNLFYFTLSKKDMKPGEYRYATRAELGTGGLLLSVAILTDSKDSHNLQAALDALKGARHITGK
jgi:hypothetical protein